MVSNQLETSRFNPCVSPDKQRLQPSPLGPKALPFFSIIATTRLPFSSTMPSFLFPVMPHAHTGLGSSLHLHSGWLANVLNSTASVLTDVHFHMPHIVHSIP